MEERVYSILPLEESDHRYDLRSGFYEALVGNRRHPRTTWDNRFQHFSEPVEQAAPISGDGPYLRAGYGSLLLVARRYGGSAMLSLDLQITTGILLIVASTLDVVSNFMFTGRSMLRWFPDTDGFLRWERGILIVALVLAAMGISLLEILLRRAGDSVLSRMGATAFVIGAVVAVVVEAGFLSRSASSPPALEVIMVVTLYIAEAILGGSLLASRLLPAWAGWTVVVWNLGLLATVVIFSPGDIYFPAAHFLPLIFVGIMLLVGAQGAVASTAGAVTRSATLP